MDIRFQWDEQKARRNLAKHKVSFETALRVFADPFHLMRQDRIENGELRWQTIGRVDEHLVLFVAHAISEADDAEIIRIISARKADIQERKRYEQNR